VGIPDNPEARTNFFVSKVKKNLHVVDAQDVAELQEELKIIMEKIAEKKSLDGQAHQGNERSTD